jgi:hypothetical protein
MAIEKTGVRKAVTRVLAAGALLAVYAVGTVTTSGVFLATSTTSADARGRGGRGGGRGGFRGGRGFRGGFRGGRGWGAWCHRPWSSRRYYCF